VIAHDPEVGREPLVDKHCFKELKQLMFPKQGFMQVPTAESEKTAISTQRI
jgi:hypothetical protein